MVSCRIELFGDGESSHLDTFELKLNFCSILLIMIIVLATPSKHQQKMETIAKISVLCRLQTATQASLFRKNFRWSNCRPTRSIVICESIAICDSTEAATDGSECHYHGIMPVITEYSNSSAELLALFFQIQYGAELHFA